MRRIKRNLCALILVSLVSTSSIRAADERALAPQEKPAGSGAAEFDFQQQFPEGPDMGGILLRLTLGTVFVLLLCVGTLWFGRRWLVGQGMKTESGKRLQLKETVRLGNRCFIHLLEVENCRVLAGTDSSGLKSLITMPDSFDKVLSDGFKPDSGDRASESSESSEQPEKTLLQSAA